MIQGKTVVLSSAELDDPDLRERLPHLLEDLLETQSPAQPDGPKIPGHTILGEIGQGGMSTVYLARQDKLGRHVAIKIAPSWLGYGERARRMIEHEAHAMARLRHPNIVVIHDVIEIDATVAISMEWVDGRTLASLLAALPNQPHPDDVKILQEALGTDAEDSSKQATDPHRHFAQLIREIAVATQVVHDNKLLHLDIKPSNVLVRRDGTPLLADFGVTREIELDTLQTKTFAGTPVYAAPEQLRRNDPKIGKSTDVYGLGITLYEALARQQPLRQMDLPSIADFIESGAMPRLSRYGQISRDLENIVHKAISPEPENRYQSAGELADDLTAYLEHRPVTARPLRLGQRIRRWARNEPWKAGLAVTLTLALPLLAGLGIYLATQWPSIEAANIASRQTKADQLKHEAYQLWLTNQTSPKSAINALKQATELDPSGTSVACLLTLAKEEGWHVASEILAEQTEREPSLGLQFFAKKVAERRCFFRDDELAQLRLSDSVGDLYFAALDQVFRAHDDHLETSAARAQKLLEEASFRAQGDPLLLGLIGWFAARAEHADRFDSVVRTIWRRWPTDAMALAWGPISIEPQDPDRAKQLARQIIQQIPTSPRGYELLAGTEYRTNDTPDAALQVLADAREVALSAPISQRLVTRLQAANGDEQAIAEQLTQARSDNDLITQLHTSRDDPESRLRAMEQILEAPEPTPSMLSEAYFMARDNEDLQDKLWTKLCELYPQRRIAHPARFTTLVKRRDYAEAAALGRDFTIPLHMCEMLSPWKARCFLVTRDYEELVRCSERWALVEHKVDEASFYQAIGYSRQGIYDLATQRIALCLHASSEGKSWYVQALLEDAFLRCAPDVPQSIRDHDWAMTRLREFDKRNQSLQRPHEGPWTRLIRGEVLLANGQIDEAIEQFEKGLQKRQRREPIAPSDYRAKLTDALARAKAQKQR